VDKQCGWTPLRFAVQYGHTAVVKLLIQNGAEVNTKFANNKTALHHACYSGNDEMCQLLLEAGALRKARCCFWKTRASNARAHVRRGALLTRTRAKSLGRGRLFAMRFGFLPER